MTSQRTIRKQARIRQQRMRDRVKAANGYGLSVLINAEATAALAILEQTHGTKTAATEHALIEQAKRT